MLLCEVCKAVAHLEDIFLRDDFGAPAHSHDCGDVHEVHELGAGEARGGPGDLVVVQPLLDLLVPGVHVQDADAPLHGRPE